MPYYSDTTTEDAVIHSALTTSITSLFYENATAHSAVITAISTTTTESAVLNDGSPNQIENLTTESAVLNDATSQQLTASTTARESAKLNDGTNSSLTTVVADAAVLNDATSQSLAAAAVVDSAVLDDASTEELSPVTVTTDSAVLDDRVFAGIVSLSTDAAVLNDGDAGSSLSCASTTDSAVLNDAIAQTVSASDTSTERAVLNDASSDQVVAVTLTLETAFIMDRIIEPPLGKAWVAGTDLFNMSRYENFPFNSLATVDGRLVGVAEDGVYLIDADDDAGTEIRAVTVGDLTDAIDGTQGPTSNPHVRRPGWLYLSYEADGTVKFVVNETGDGQETRHEFDLPPRAALDVIGGRAQLDAGLEARFFRFGFENVDGSRFSVDDSRVSFAMLQRRA